MGWDEFNYHNKQKEKHYAKRALSDYNTTIIKSRNEVSKKEQIDALNDNSRSSNNNKQENSTTKMSTEFHSVIDHTIYVEPKRVHIC